MALIKSIPAKRKQLISTQTDTEIGSDQCFHDMIILTNSKFMLYVCMYRLLK